MNNQLAELKKIPFIKATVLIASGLTKKKACEQVNISVDTYDRYMDDNPDIVNEFIQTSQSQLLELYEDVDAAYIKVIEKLILQANEDLSLKELATLETKLNSIRDKIQFAIDTVTPKTNITDTNSKINAEDFLSMISQGPTPKRAKGKATISRTESLTIDLEPDETEEVIDGQVEDSS